MDGVKRSVTCEIYDRMACRQTSAFTNRQRGARLPPRLSVRRVRRRQGRGARSLYFLIHVRVILI